MFDSDLARARVLLSQARPEEARRLLLRMATERPGDAEVQMLLAYAHGAANEHEAAEQHAREAIALAPDEAACHATLARVLTGATRKRGEALAAALTAVALEPTDPDHHALVALGHVAHKSWNLVLEAADEGLALDPEHADCVNLRAIALRSLGRSDEASRVLGKQLGRTPNDAWTHSNQGWTLLHGGDHRGAEQHFREALALEPNHEPARLGIREALQARHWFYRPILRFFLWMSSFEGRKQAAILIGGWLLYNVGVRMTSSGVLLVQVAAIGFVVAYLLFAAGTWFAGSFAAALLAFHPLGRLALTPLERRFGLGVSVAVLSAAAMLGLAIAGVEPLLLAPAVLLVCVAAAARSLPSLNPGKPRRTYGAFVALVLVLALVSGWLETTSHARMRANADEIDRVMVSLGGDSDEYDAAELAAALSDAAAAPGSILSPEEVGALSGRLETGQNLRLGVVILALWISQLVLGFAAASERD